MAESLHRLQELLDFSPLGMFSLDEEGCYTVFNRSHAVDMQKLFEARPELGHPFLDYIPQPDQRENVRRDLQRAAAGQVLESLHLVGMPQAGRSFEISYLLCKQTSPGICLVAEGSGSASLGRAVEYNRSLIEVSPDPLMTIGPDGRITDVNHATEKATGYSRIELIGTDFSSYFTEPEQARAGYQQVFRDGQVLDYPLELRHRSGQTLSVLYNAVVYRNAHGAVIGVFAAARDVTDRLRAEHALRSASEYNRSLIEVSLDPLVTIGPDGRITDVNRATEKATGCTRAELIGTDFSSYFTEPEQARAGYQQVFRDGQVLDYPLELRHRSGQTLSVLYNASVYRDAHGAVIGVFAAARDVTDRQRAEQALRSASEYNRSLIEVSPDPLVTIGPDGRITDVNRATERATGCTRAELIGTDFSSYFTEPEQARAGYQQVFRDGQVLDYPLELRHRSGQTFSVLYNASVYRDAHGAVIGVFAAARDVTDRLRAEQDLQAAHDVLEQRVLDRTAELSTANLALQKAILSRDQFLAAMSHEMRTPLTGILGLSQALMFNTDGSLGPRHLKALETIEKSGQRLLQLVNNVIDYNQLKFGKALFVLAPCSIQYICKASLQAMRARADAKQQRLDLLMEPENIQCLLDEKRIRQMLGHLLDNAIKFSPENTTITLSATGLPETGQLRLSVTDQGIGIPPEDLPRLFDPLVQLDATLSRGYQGSGLGLPLVEALAELHGGEVQVQSSPGQGSCFSVILPCHEVK